MYRQFLQLSSLTSKYRLTSDDYYRYRLYALHSNEAMQFFPLRSNITIREHLYSRMGLDHRPLSDKRQFQDRCEKAGLPIPEAIADFANGSVRWRGYERLPACDLFLKYAAWYGGKDATFWRFEGASGRWSSDKTSGLDATELIAHVSESSRRAPLILQRCITNHPELNDLGPGACTVRLVTMKEPGGEIPVISLPAAFRVPAASQMTDNFSQGGLGCPIDPQTGVLGAGVRKDAGHAHHDFSRHPETGALIEGRQLPLWTNTVSLALDAHRVFAEFPSIGWDIAITPAGPVLIEGNYNWGVPVVQQVGRHPLGRTDFPRHYLAWLASTENPDHREQS